MQTIKEDKNAVDVAVKYLSEGKLVFFATETVYIAAVDATNANAVKKLVAFKNRPFGKPFSVGVTDIKMAQKYVNINSAAKKLYEKFLPGPLTVVSQGLHTVAHGVEAENGTLGIRIPDYKFALDVIKKFGKPITTTSANASYQRRPYKLSDILENISSKQKDLIDLMVDAGELPHNEPSTVIDTTLDDITVLRQGEMKLKNKNEVLSRSEENTQNIGKELWQKYENYQGKRAIVFALQGEMGTGKTIFTKGLARAMGIKELVTSPTFAIENEYISSTRYSLSPIRLYHFDAWRMENANEMRTLGFENLIKNKSVISIEWAERVADVIRKFDEEAIIVWINFSYLPRRSPAKSGGNTDNQRLISWGNL